MDFVLGLGSAGLGTAGLRALPSAGQSLTLPPPRMCLTALPASSSACVRACLRARAQLRHYRRRLRQRREQHVSPRHPGRASGLCFRPGVCRLGHCGLACAAVGGSTSQAAATAHVFDGAAGVRVCLRACLSACASAVPPPSAAVNPTSRAARESPASCASEWTLFLAWGLPPWALRACVRCRRRVDLSRCRQRACG